LLPDGHDTSALVHHSDRGVPYLAIRYPERLAEAGAVASVVRSGPQAHVQCVQGQVGT